MLEQWAIKWGVSRAALNDLQEQVGIFSAPITTGDTPEAVVQARVRLAASREGCILWRNNVGAYQSEKGFVRYGLANESHAMNQAIKSSDLIGIRPVLITPEMVGSTLGRFVAIECKRGGWKYTGTQREQAQLKFLHLIAAKGGEGKFAS